MSNVRAFRVEAEFRRIRSFGRSGALEVHWTENAPPHKDGLKFKVGDVLVMYVAENMPNHKTWIHHGTGTIAYSETAITNEHISQLTKEQLIREMA